MAGDVIKSIEHETNRVIIKAQVEGELHAVRKALDNVKRDHAILALNERFKTKLEVALSIIDEVKREVRQTDLDTLFDYEKSK